MVRTKTVLLVGAVIVGLPFFVLGSIFVLSVLSGSLRNYDEQFFEESKQLFVDLYGGVPTWVEQLHHPISGLRDSLYRHPLFHLHVWLGTIWFVGVPFQLTWARKRLGNTFHIWFGRFLLICYFSVMLLLKQTVSIPYEARDPAGPFFFLCASGVTSLFAFLGWRAIRNKNVVEHRQHMWRAWLPPLMAILGVRVWVIAVYPLFLDMTSLHESLLASAAWFHFTMAHVIVTLFIKPSTVSSSSTTTPKPKTS